MRSYLTTCCRRENVYAFLSVVFALTFSLSFSALYFINTLLNLEKFKVLPEASLHNIPEATANEKFLFSANVIFSIFLFFSSLRTGDKLLCGAIRKKTDLRIETFLTTFWKRSCGLSMVYFLACFSTFYASASIGLNLYKVIEHYFEEKSIPVGFSLATFILSAINLIFYFLFKDTPSSDKASYHLPCNERAFIFSSGMVATGYSIGNAFLFINTIILMLNAAKHTDMSFDWDDNTTGQNAFLSILIIFAAIPMMYTLGTTYHNLIKKGFNTQDSRLFDGHGFAEKVPNPLKYYVAGIRSIIQEIATVTLVIKLMGENHKQGTTLGITLTLCTLSAFASFFSRVALYLAAEEEGHTRVDSRSRLMLAPESNQA